MPAGPLPAITTSYDDTSAIGLNLHAGPTGNHAAAAMRFAADGDAALEADAYAAQWSPGLTGIRSPEWLQ